MATLYLIAHRVRGEVAFDIAIPMQIGDEEGWLIPTSGHRAYPFLEVPIYVDEDQIHIDQDTRVSVVFDLPPLPPDLPDHYQTTAAKGQGLVKDLLSALGLPKARPPQVKRRI